MLEALLLVGRLTLSCALEFLAYGTTTVLSEQGSDPHKSRICCR